MVVLRRAVELSDYGDCLVETVLESAPTVDEKKEVSRSWFYQLNTTLTRK